MDHSVETKQMEPSLPLSLRFPQMEEAASFHPMPSMSNHLPERYVLETLARGFHRPILHDIVSPLRLKKLPYKSRSYINNRSTNILHLNKFYWSFFLLHLSYPRRNGSFA